MSAADLVGSTNYSSLKTDGCVEELQRGLYVDFAEMRNGCDYDDYDYFAEDGKKSRCCNQSHESAAGQVVKELDELGC